MQRGRPSAVTNKIPAGYEFIDRRNIRDFHGQNGLIVLLIYEIDGRQYFRKYRPQRIGYVGYLRPNVSCYVYRCTKCKTKGKKTLLKIVRRTGRIYAQTAHHRECVMQVYDMEDD